MRPSRLQLKLLATVLRLHVEVQWINVQLLWNTLQQIWYGRGGLHVRGDGTGHPPAGRKYY